MEHWQIFIMLAAIGIACVIIDKEQKDEDQTPKGGAT